MNHDPQGYYARLEVDWDAPPEAIHTAYRRKARVLHPDIPVTGNAAAFVALKEAYDVLSDPLRRAAYERASRSLDQLRTTVHATEQYHPPSPPPQPSAQPRGPRLSDLPLGVWAILAMVVVFAGFEAVLHLTAPPSQDQTVDVPATAPTVPPQAPPPPPRPIRLFGISNVYVVPTGSPAVVLRYDPGQRAFIPIGQLPPFSTAQAIRVLHGNGLVEIRLTASAVGFIPAARLSPGNAEAAYEAYCAYNAGTPPANGEILGRAGAGAGETTIENRSGQPVVVKLRDRNGVAVATVFLAPGGDALVDGLPGGAYRPDYAMGDLWSRACNMFAAGMRAQRFAGYADLSALPTVVIPPELPGQAPPVDISDQDFEHD
ncbi:MAG TPA: J domain-containing protein [Acetobacteraceae bacterium]|nr:J domain-containing protein [Acetobacteraceae bacterium]